MIGLKEGERERELRLPIVDGNLKEPTEN